MFAQETRSNGAGYRQTTFPLSVTVTHAPIRIGIIHGHQCIPTGDLDSLSAIARQMDVDVLISGHTHTYDSCDLEPPFPHDHSSRFQAVEYDGRFFVNPGSATGAWTGLWNGCVSCGGLMGTVDHTCDAHSDYPGSRPPRLR